MILKYRNNTTLLDKLPQEYQRAKNCKNKKAKIKEDPFGNVM